MKILRATALLAVFAIFVPVLSNAGEFLRSSGTTSWEKGGKQISITLTVDNSGGQLSPTVAWSSGGVTQTDVMSSFHLQPGRWFAFVENETAIWIFDGADSLRLVLVTAGTLSDSDAVERLRPIPQEVRESLPESVRKKYSHGG